MGVKEFLEYESFIQVQNRQLEIWGQPCEIYTPTRKIALGYEDTNPTEVQRMDADVVLGNKYTKYNSRIWINFTIAKSVFYKFNWFPEEGEELCMAFINSDATVNENDYIRTATTEATSVWGDMLFKVIKIQDVGLSQVLQRIYFLKPTANADLQKELSL